MEFVVKGLRTHGESTYNNYQYYPEHDFQVSSYTTHQAQGLSFDLALLLSILSTMAKILTDSTDFFSPCYKNQSTTKWVLHFYSSFFPLNRSPLIREEQKGKTRTPPGFPGCTEHPCVSLTK